MAEKAVSLRPSLSDVSPNDGGKIAALVAAGGSSATTEAEKKDIARQKRQEKKLSEPTVNVRVPVELLQRMDVLRAQRTGKISRNTWILEAIEDKVERETV